MIPDAEALAFARLRLAASHALSGTEGHILICDIYIVYIYIYIHIHICVYIIYTYMHVHMIDIHTDLLEI